MEALCKRLLTEPSLRSLALKLAKDKHEDLIQEVALVICEMDKPEKIEGYFNFWCVRTMINMTSSTGKFWKKHSDRYYDIDELSSVIRSEYDKEPDEFWNDLDRIFDPKKEWYHREVIRLYYEAGSYRNVEALTGINHVSIYNTVKEAKQMIQERI